MALHRDQAVGSLDFGIGGVGGDAEDGVRRVLVQTCDLVHDLALEAHLPEDVLVQGSVHLLQLLLRQLSGFLFRLFCRQLQFPGQRQVVEDKAVQGAARGLQRPSLAGKGPHQLHGDLQLQVGPRRAAPARVASQAHSPIRQRQLLGDEGGPITFRARPKAKECEGVSDGVGGLALEDLLVQPIGIAVAANYGPQGATQHLQLATARQFEVRQHREGPVQHHLRALRAGGLA
mmetsp:Transcript_102710/g.230651  ORF Transcript_102710/g.230651 Transcript_102710/m.230651 type:complete len:232 (+) Transcript_102710:478-1173(+)